MAAKTTDETNHHHHHHHHHNINNNNNINNSINDLLSGWGTGRPCNICLTAASLIYCNTDSAFFCGPCDAKIHPPTSFPRHERVWVCEVCTQLPSVFACKADDANLCSACDHDIHSVNPLARRHDRVPVIPFYDSPIDAAAARSASAVSAFLVPENLDSASAISAGGADDDANTWLIPNPNSTFLYNDSDILNYSNNNYGCPKFVTNSPQFQRQDDAKPSAILEDDNHRNYASADSVVPSQSQGNTYNNNKNSNNFAVDSNHNFVNSISLFDNCFNIDFTQPNKLQKKNNNDSHLLSPSFNYSASSSETGVVPDGSASSMSSEISYSFAKSTAGDGSSFGGAPVMDREARVLRYREKRKNRKFEKTIRYASRKAYAETRPRVKGRFAKRTDSSETSEVDFAGDNGGYGVVPAF